MQNDIEISPPVAVQAALQMEIPAFTILQFAGPKKHTSYSQAECDACMGAIRNLYSQLKSYISMIGILNIYISKTQ